MAVQHALKSITFATIATTVLLILTLISQSDYLLGRNAQNHLKLCDHKLYERSECNCAMKTVNPQYKVPNIVHYCWYANVSKEWTFTQYLSVLSFHRFLKPTKILFHTNMLPKGYYWNRTVQIPGFHIIWRQPTKQLFGRKLDFPYETTACNLDRLLILNRTGGIFIDTDVIAVKSFDNLRKYSATMGSQNKDYFYDLCGGILVAEPGSTFIKLWINSFIDDYRPDIWAFNSGRQPAYIGIFRFKETLHVEHKSLHIPNWEHTEEIFAGKHNWHNNYAIHLFLRKWKQHNKFTGVPTEVTIAKENTTFGEIARRTLYGSSSILHDKVPVISIPWPDNFNPDE